MEIGDNEFEITELVPFKSFTTQILYGMEEYLDNEHQFFSNMETIGSSKKAGYCLKKDKKLEAIHGSFFKDKDKNFYYQDLCP